MQKVVFLDRDGVINKYPGDGDYVKNCNEFKFIPGSIVGLHLLRKAGFKLFVISNQSGIQKGIFSEKDLNLITKMMLTVLRSYGISLDGVYYCPHTKVQNCNCRKPKTGLLEKAVSTLKATPDVSFFIGDSIVDIETAKNFNAKSILVLSGKEKLANQDNWKVKPDYIFENLLVASFYLFRHFNHNNQCQKKF